MSDVTIPTNGGVECRTGGFTLIELLVVIAVIAILAALLLPALAKAKYSAKNAQCRNNLRQISLGVALYTSTHGAFPPYTSDGDSPRFTLGFSGEGWCKLMELPVSYIKGTNLSVPAPWAYRILGGVFRCPLNQGGIMTILLGDGGSQIVGSEQVLQPSLSAYGYNAWGILRGPDRECLGLGGYSAPLPQWRDMRSTPESAVRAPSDMIALGDEFLRSRNAALDGMIRGEATIAPVSGFDAGDQWGYYSPKNPPKKQPSFKAHHGRANRAFVDGHLESEDMRKPFAASDAQLKRWNVDNEPHRNRLTD